MALKDSTSISHLRQLAWLLDSSIRIPGTRLSFGIDALIGLVPGLGDLVGTALSAYIVAGAWRAGISKTTLVHMLFNIAIESIFGAVPVLGDIFDAAWKANQRNIRLLETHAQDPRRAKRSSLGFFILILFVLIMIVLGAGTLTYFCIQALRAL
ncbi:MAG TPA: DUF4112 domain-containing protein [Burkholderiales bacterium]|nr:DUF4112 domain-containing protein [Burkholderiales bacterium]